MSVLPGGCQSVSGTAMRAPTTRRHKSRNGLRFETYLTDAEWAVIEPLLPERLRLGRPPAVVPAGDRERHLLRSPGWDRVAPLAHRPAAQEHGLGPRTT